MMARTTPLNMSRNHWRSLAGCLGLAALMADPGVASVSQAQAQARFISPTQIDRSVENFTGHAAGTIGGARNRADPRLRLAACSNPLSVTWHGNRQSTLRVACEGQSPWHIFMAIRAAPPPAKAAKVVQRGDTVTIAIKGQGFTVRRPGEAQQAGAIGEWITVKTDRKAKPVSAQIVRPGLVVIPI